MQQRIDPRRPGCAVPAARQQETVRRLAASGFTRMLDGNFTGPLLIAASPVSPLTRITPRR
jgi:hypothetical protein